MIQIVASGKNSRVTLPCCFGQRLLALPGLNHNVLGQIGGQHLVPALCSLAVFGDDLLDALGEISLQVVIVLDLMLAHECLNLRVFLPLLSVYFVAPDVEKRIWK